MVDRDGREGEKTRENREEIHNETTVPRNWNVNVSRLFLASLFEPLFSLFNQFGDRGVWHQEPRVTSFSGVLRWIKRAFKSFQIVKLGKLLPPVILPFFVCNLAPIAASEREARSQRNKNHWLNFNLQYCSDEHPLVTRVYRVPFVFSLFVYRRVMSNLLINCSAGWRLDN